VSDVAPDRCEGCGFVYDLDRAAEASGQIRAGASELGVLLREHAADASSRREPTTWSPLEYGCHVRDVLLVQRERVLETRRRERPAFTPMGRDERVEHDGYSEQDPTAVARQLDDAALLLAHVLDRLGPEDWERLVVYSYPVEWERSLRWVAVHTVHEVRHHLVDVQVQLEA
jgi:hypothetical protein